MKKYNSIAITLIVLGMLANSCGPALAESSEPFPDEEWNRTHNVGEIYHVQCIQKTSDGGYVTARGFQLVKFGGVKPEPLQSGILQETPIATQTLRAVSNETQTVIPLEKTAGFESFISIAIILVVYLAGRKIT
jgi:hypothetical protein